VLASSFRATGPIQKSETRYMRFWIHEPPGTASEVDVSFKVDI
jgi:hypothetical protein